MLKTMMSAAVFAQIAMLTGCAADRTEADGGPAADTAQVTTEAEGFVLRLPDSTTAETAIPALVQAGHARLATMCQSSPGGAIRILNPLAPGVFEDLPCSTILEGTATAGSALRDDVDGPTGQVEQRFGPISLLACALGTVGTGLFTRYAVCPNGATEQDRTRCNDAGLWGSAGLTFVCTLPFLPIFF